MIYFLGRELHSEDNFMDIEEREELINKVEIGRESIPSNSKDSTGSYIFVCTLI
jgi:hypothetical protein